MTSSAAAITFLVAGVAQAAPPRRPLDTARIEALTGAKGTLDAQHR